MFKKKLIVLILVLSFILIANLMYAIQYKSAFKLVHPRSFAMGGAFSALADDQSIFFINPAGMALGKKVNGKPSLTSIIEITARVNSTLFDYVNFITKYASSFADPTQILNIGADDLNKMLGQNVGVGLAGPVYFGFISNDPYSPISWGFTVVAPVIDMGFRIGREAPFPNIEIVGQAYAVARGGVAISIPILSKTLPDLHIGITAKAYARGDIYYLENLLNITNIMNTITNNLNYGFGGGLDVGAIWELTKDINVSMIINDIFSMYSAKNVATNINETNLVKMNFAIGFSYKLSPLVKVIANDLILSDAVVAVDITNMFDDEYSFWTNLHIGVELWTLKRWIAVRFGLNQGYGTLGVGVRLFNAVNIDWAVYQRELGKFPGDLTEMTHNLSIGVHF